MTCLGLVPTLGGPDEPLHWLMTAAMTGFGVLLFARHQLVKRTEPLAEVPRAEAQRAGRAVLWVAGVSALLMGGIAARQVLAGGQIGALSVLMPAAALVWLASLGFKALRFPAAEPGLPAETDRPSRRPGWERLSSPPPGAPPGGPSGHVSA